VSFAFPVALAAIPLLFIITLLRIFYPPRSVRLLQNTPLIPIKMHASWRLWFRRLPEVLQLLALASMCVALARPQSVSAEKEIESQGIDMMLCLDVSGSMQAQDFKPNRLGAAKEVADAFIAGRTNDRLGLVVFAGEAYTQCPMTLDHTLLRGLLRDVGVGKMEDGTAIGLAMATGLNRMRKSESKSRVLILLTDGENNRGVDPRTILDMAVQLGITVHCVGVGQEGFAPMPVQTPFGSRIQQVEVHIDEELLNEISLKTGGQYFRARDLSELKAIWDEIDRLERSEILIHEYRLVDEHFQWALLAALLLIIGQYASSAILRRPLA
jgi:Ca-activated chloride channel homolog